MNSIIIKGRLTRDPELKTTGSGVSVCSFSVAVDREYQKQGEDKVCDFFNCNAWRVQGEFVSKYFVKGQEILVRGEMQSRKYEDKQGNNRIAWEIQVDRAEFCGSKQNGTGAASDTSNPTEGFTEVEDESLPF